MHPAQAKFVFLTAAVLASIHPITTTAKLGEDMPALTKRFGSNYQPVPISDKAEAAYLFTATNIRVLVWLVKGRSVLEYYYSDKPLVKGRPPESIWRAVRDKNAPGVKWQPSDKGFVSADNRYSTWFETPWVELDAASASPKTTHGLGICDRYAMTGDAKFAGTTHKADNLPVATVGGIPFDPQHNAYSYQYFQAAESEGKHVYAARTFQAAECEVYDYPSHFVGLEEGEPLRVISVDPETYGLLVERLRFNTMAHVRRTAVIIR